MDKKFENRKNLKTEKGITCKISLNGHANIYETEKNCKAKGHIKSMQKLRFVKM